MWVFEVGHRYRRRDLHAEYGGQQQGGISTPKKYPLILLITGQSGAAYGYNDGWEDDGTFRYFGEGQRGDMPFVRGNRAIRDHAADGRELHLFEDVRRGFLRYRGLMTCAGYSLVPNVADVEGNPRTAIAFHLMPSDAVDNEAEPDLEERAPAGEGLWELPLAELRQTALQAPQETQSKEARVRVWLRSRALRVYVLRRAHGKCEACERSAPFITAAGRPYLESHHTRRLSDGGPDDPRWVIAVCPNCHRRAHYGEDAQAFNQALQDKLAKL
jgi:5-methylcytosine-specific restriction protein A